jgi:putative membrane protein
LDLSYYLEIWSAFSIIAFIGAYQIISLYLRSLKYGIAVNDEVLMHLSGTFGNRATLLSIHKIQSIKLIQNIYQRRKNLADVLINTAGGYIRIPYIKLNDANTIRNYCLFKVETSNSKWM